MLNKEKFKKFRDWLFIPSSRVVSFQFLLGLHYTVISVLRYWETISEGFSSEGYLLGIGNNDWLTPIWFFIFAGILVEKLIKDIKIFPLIIKLISLYVIGLLWTILCFGIGCILICIVDLFFGNSIFKTSFSTLIFNFLVLVNFFYTFLLVYGGLGNFLTKK